MNTNEKLKLCKLSFELNIDKKFEKRIYLDTKYSYVNTSSIVARFLK